jgi:lipoate-protein ligase A
MPDVRLLPGGRDDGPHNMAADEALLESAAAGVASFRLYGWTAPTLSLGYFQAAGPARAEPRLASLPRVRRATGGAALVHHHDITYALALPPDFPWQRRDVSWPRLMHTALQSALATYGVGSALCPPGGERKRGEVLCFLHHTPDDLLIGEDKIAGSAQRKRHGALLQHGSLLLASSPATPELPGVAELAGVRLAEDAMATALREEFTRHTGWALIPGDWTHAERRRRDELASSKYGRPTWTDKR